MDNQLFNAVLAIDAYNRGYGPTIKFGSTPNSVWTRVMRRLL